MSRFLLVLCAVAVAPALAAAEAKPVDKPDIAKLVASGDLSGATFGFAGNANYAGAAGKDIAKDLPANHTTKNVAGGFSKNKKAYWASADLLPTGGKAIDGHASALWEKAGTDWKLVAFSVVPTATGKQQQDAIKKGVAPSTITAKNGADSEYFLRIFAGVFSESADEQVSARKEVVMFGSGANERYVGGAKVAKTLAGWNLAFEVRGDIGSGLTKGKLLWIGVNLDARSKGKPTSTPVPYRAFLIFEGDDSGSYEMVHASFAAVTEQTWAK